MRRLDGVGLTGLFARRGIIIILSAFLTLGINIRGAGSLFRNDMDSTIERRARGDDDDDSFHTASALTPSSIIMASLPA